MPGIVIQIALVDPVASCCFCEELSTISICVRHQLQLSTIDQRLESPSYHSRVHPQTIALVCITALCIQHVSIATPLLLRLCRITTTRSVHCEMYKFCSNGWIPIDKLQPYFHSLLICQSNELNCTTALRPIIALAWWPLAPTVQIVTVIAHAPLLAAYILYVGQVTHAQAA